MDYEYNDNDLGIEATQDLYREAQESWTLLNEEDDKGE